MFDGEHRRIYECILATITAGKTADVITVAEEGFDLAYLGSLAANTPSSKTIARYAEIIADRAQERALLAASGEISDLVARVGFPVKDKIDRAQAAIMAISDTVTSKEPRAMGAILTDVAIDLENLLNGKTEIVSCGYTKIDEKVQLLEPQNLVIIAGRPAMGKTAVAINIAERYAAAGASVLICSQEMSDVSLGKRMLAMKGKIDLNRILRGTMSDDDFMRMTFAAGALGEEKIYIDEQGELNLLDVHTKARSVRRKHGLDLLVIDYLQLMAGKGENRQQEITAISRGLKGLAKEMDIPVIALSQLNRGVESRPNKRPMMSDLRESGAIEQDADVIVFMYRDEYYYPDSPDKGMAEFIIAKNRNGEVGTVPLVWIGEHQRFETFAGNFEPAPTVSKSGGRYDV